jgi:YjbR
VPEYADVPPEVLASVRAICLALPDAYEEEAWTGVRWLVRRRTFAHVLTVEGGQDSAHARAAATDAPTTLVTFRSAGEELHVLRHAGHPFFYAGWGRDVVGMVLDAATDWDEVAELLTESYCVLAPKKLVALVDRPTG